MNNREYAKLAHQANLQGKILLADGTMTDPPEPTAEELAAIEAAENASAAMITLNRVMQKQVAETATLTDAEIAVIARAGYFDEWQAGVEYAAGKRLTYDGVVYVVIQDVTAQAHQPPGADGMLAVYRPIGVNTDGTLDNPIPYIDGMDVDNGKYYSYHGGVYLAKADLKPCVWPPDTAGIWQWEKEA